MRLADLQRLVRQGEGMQLEFKRKAKHPEKIARELIAFANTEGGTLLVGVDDDARIYGSKFIEEEVYVISSFMNKHCWPHIPLRYESIPVNAQREVLSIRVPASRRKPHFLVSEPRSKDKQAFVRVADMSIRASYEMVQLLKHTRKKRGVSFAVGDSEKKMLELFEQVSRITLDEVASRLQVSRRKASHTLVLLACAGLIRINPSNKGDYYSLAEEAFYH